MKEERNVLIESARIARGEIKALSEYKVANFDAWYFLVVLVLLKTYLLWHSMAPMQKVNPDVEKAVLDTLNAGKPIGALCIAPAFIAKIIGDVEVTIGQDKGTAEAIEKNGCHTHWNYTWWSGSR